MRLIFWTAQKINNFHFNRLKSILHRMPSALSNYYRNCNCLSTGSLICTCTPEDNPGTGCSYCHLLGCNGESQNGGGGNGNGNNGTGSVNINWTNNTTLNSLIQEVLATNSALISEVTREVEEAQIDVTMRLSDTLSNIACAFFSLSDAFIGEDYTIWFRSNISLLSSSAQKVIVLHEMLHLNIYAKLVGENRSTLGNVLPNFNQYYIENEENFNEASHEYFAANYLNQIEDIIEIIAPDLEADKAKWASLTGTEAYEDLPLAQREDIMNYLTENNL
ncbi:MAG: hypothetical protein IJE52_07730 [Bacteroidales bacterium]|nr:hypothetical protein [Bacteroidales bacterium]